MSIATWLLDPHAHEERVARIGGRRNGESRLAVNGRIKGDVDVVGRETTRRERRRTLNAEHLLQVFFERFHLPVLYV